MAADSGGLFARKKDTCLQFASKPTAIVYLPSLNSLVGTLSNGSIEVYDIHSGCMLKQVDFTGKIDQTPHQLWGWTWHTCEVLQTFIRDIYTLTSIYKAYCILFSTKQVFRVFERVWFDETNIFSSLYVRCIRLHKYGKDAKKAAHNS